MSSNTLYAGKVLGRDERLTSNNGVCVLIMQGDGNCVAYLNGLGTAIWHTDTARRGVTASVTENGVFVIRNSSGSVVYSSSGNMARSDGYKLVLQNDGNLVMYNDRDVPVWHTDRASRVVGNVPTAKESGD